MKIHSHKTSQGGRLCVALAAFSLIGLTGCHDWPDERVTAIEAQNILRDLSRIETIPDPNLQGPAIYKSPPKKIKQVVGGGEEWKLIYFCQYHTADEMKTLVTEQFATKLFNEKGVSTTIADYTVSSSPASNQLIVRCPLEKDIDAVIEILKEADIPPIQVRIDCLVSELYADMTVDRETSMEIQNLFGEGIKLTGEEDNDFIAFPGAELRDSARAKFGLKIGVQRDNFMALVDILVSRGYLKILMNPSLEVVNGETAKIQSKQHQPLQEVTVQSGGFGGEVILRTQLEYYEIIDSLEITPHVYADGYIGLKTSAQIASYLTPEGIKQNPVVTERTITNKDNRIRLGESLVIGGIRKSEKRDVIRGVPILKDIPVLNLLFSGRDFEERATEVIFILTPSISTGGRSNQEMVEEMRERHSSPMTQSLPEAVLDPLGTKAREDEQQRRDDLSTRQEVQAARNAARIDAIQTSQQVENLETELEQTKIKMAQLNTKAEQAQAETQKATAEAQQAKTEAENATKAKAEAEAAKTKAEAEAAQAKAEAQKAKTDAEAKEAKAEAEAQKPPAQSDQPKPQEAPKEPGQSPPPPAPGDAAKPPA